MALAFVDILPDWQYQAADRLVGELLPHEWYKKLLPREKLAWADIFSRGGFAVYDGRLAHEWGKGVCRGDCVGTFIVTGDKSYFIGSDEKGTWAHELDGMCGWQCAKTCALLTQTCSGIADMKATTWHARISSLVELIQFHAKKRAVFRALLSLGRLYYPTVNNF